MSIRTMMGGMSAGTSYKFEHKQTEQKVEID